MLMERQFDHGLLPSTLADERARQDFVQSLKLYLAQKVVPGIEAVYEGRVRPAFEQAHGRPPRDHDEVDAVMNGNYYYRLWASLYRTAQEMMWSCVAEPILRQREDMARAAVVENPAGSLKLNPALEVPRYLSAVDIHCMPGSYHSEVIDGDVMQGALYDRGVHIYGMGGLGPKLGKAGELVGQFVHARFPQLRDRPLRILDLGCTVGHSTLAYAEMFPDAEIHAIDVAAPVLRYAHARAEAMGIPVHFRQMNAEEMGYPDNHFDLVVSHIVLHETSSKAIRRIMEECWRVLKPGGVTAHIDLCFFEDLSPFNGFMMMFDGPNNNEPFWGTLRKMKARSLLTDAGFAEDAVFEQFVSRAYQGQAVFSEGASDAGRGTWKIIGGVK